MLADTEIVPYLIGQGLLSARSVVAGDVVLTIVSRRNRSCKVTCAEGPSYFVKQGVDDERRATVARGRPGCSPCTARARSCFADRAPPASTSSV